MFLGVIADDFTGATDVAGMLVRAGMRTVQTIGVPFGVADAAPSPAADAVVVALKSRTAPVAQAVAESVAALDWLRAAGAQRFYFKYCSTFDSTPAGNIGPVAEALMQALKTDFTIACPAFPANKRTIYKGYLFVGDELLSESGMRNHPLTPMTDPSLVRVLQQQVKGRVGLVEHQTVAKGSAAVAGRMAELRAQGAAFAIVDALTNHDLVSIGAACADLPLITGGSGIALGLPENFRRRGLLARLDAADRLPEARGLRAVIAGSCSAATQKQVQVMQKEAPSFAVDPLALARGDDVAAAALAWAAQHIETGPVLVYATASPEQVKDVQSQLGAAQAGELVERTLAAIAVGLVKLGVGQLIVAGGETSGAVVGALGVQGLRIGPEIDPGVPALAAAEGEPMALALKSGNFGAPDFFARALDALGGQG